MADQLLFRGGNTSSVAGSTVNNREIVVDTQTNQIVLGSAKDRTVMERSTLYVNGGSVGVGISSPQTKIDSIGTIQARQLDDSKGVQISDDGGLELFRNDSAGFIDFKTSRSEDHDCRIQQDDNGLTFSTGGQGQTAERLRIDRNGELRINTFGQNVNVGSGTTDGVTFYHPSNPLAGAFQVSTNGGPAMYLRRRTSDGTMVQFNRDTSIVGEIRVNSTSTSYIENSDYRLKENVVDITDGITRVKQLQPRRFNFIIKPEETVDGFLAHEAQAVVPQAVSGEKDGEEMQGIDKSKLVPLLTAALKEAIAKIETLETKVAALESN